MPGLSVRRSLPVFSDGPFDWSAWWASLISATVEDAAPTHVVLTFPTGVTSLGTDDITVTINGVDNPVISTSWAGGVWTIVMTDPVVYGDEIVITFVPTGDTNNVTNNVAAEAEYTALLAALTGTTPAIAIRKAHNEFIKYITGNNSDSRNTYVKLCCLMMPNAGMPTASDSLIWWNNPARTGVLSGTPPVYKIGQGWMGNGATSYVDTDWNPSEDGGGLFTQNAAGGGMLFSNHRHTISVANNNGVSDGSNNGLVFAPKYTGTNANYFRIGATLLTISGIYQADYLWTLVQESATQATVYNDNNSSGLLSSTSLALLDGNIYLGAVNKLGTGAASFNKDTIGCFFTGSKLDAIDVKVIRAALDALIAVLVNEISISATITVGGGKDYATVEEGIGAAVSGNAVVIDTGTYNETIRLHNKKITVQGSGTQETIIRYSTIDITYKTVDTATDSTLDNLILSNTSNVGDGILQIVGCNPVFTNCLINHPTGGRNNAVLINTGSSVIMTDCSIDLFRGGRVVIADTSKLTFTGTRWKVNLTISGTAVANIDTDEFWTDQTATKGGLRASGDSKVYLNVNTREIYFNNSTGLEYAAGVYGSSSYLLSDNAYFELSGNQITSGIGVGGAGNVVLFKNIVSTLGRFWLNTGVAAATAEITFDNCQITFDADNDATGLHIIEDTVRAQVNIINGCILTFSGHNGNWFTMGNPIVSMGKLYIRDSSIIDNCNDNVPFGGNYAGTIFCRKIDAEDSIITNQNWDSVGANRNIVVNKDVGVDMQIRLKNVVLNNSEINTSPLYIGNGINALDVTDYYCEDNVTYNSSAYKLLSGAGVPATIYAALVAACPD